MGEAGKATRQEAPGAEISGGRKGKHGSPGHKGGRFSRFRKEQALRGVGWSCQKPERQARERDEKAIEKWRTERWPHIEERQAGRQSDRISR